MLDHWWQTETSHAITGTCVGLGNSLNPPTHSSGKPVPGFDVRVMREDGREAGPGELGRIVCKLPMAPGTMMTLYNAPDRFREAYFEKFPVNNPRIQNDKVHCIPTKTTIYQK